MNVGSRRQQVLDWPQFDFFVHQVGPLQGLASSLVQIRAMNGKIERLFSVKQIPRGFDPWEFWIGLAPDDSLLMMRDRSTQEIYSLDVRLP